MSETKHTPEQWSIDKNQGASHVPGLTPCGRDWTLTINDDEGRPTAYATGYDQEEAERAAEKIVRAVNAHEAMLEALKEAAEELAYHADDMDNSLGVLHIVSQVVRRRLNQARSAIALAEKGEVL